MDTLNHAIAGLAETWSQGVRRKTWKGRDASRWIWAPPSVSGRSHTYECQLRAASIARKGLRSKGSACLF